MDEFKLIHTFFQQSKLSWKTDNIEMGIGDDCAIVKPLAEQSICLSMDTLIEGVHFPQDSNPYHIGTRSLCVTLSDLAAMGAIPIGFTLAITLPNLDAEWLTAFSSGLADLAQLYKCPLIGGDTTKGPSLVISIQVHGWVPTGQALKRSGAQLNDYVYVSGPIGDGAGALPIVLDNINSQHSLVDRFWRPLPQINFGNKIINDATACIDISDGLIQDLNHICRSSEVGINLSVDNIPLSDELLSTYTKEDALQFALTGGDDYQLAFTSSQVIPGGICIGRVTQGNHVKLDRPTSERQLDMKGYQHFS